MCPSGDKHSMSRSHHQLRFCDQLQNCDKRGKGNSFHEVQESSQFNDWDGSYMVNTMGQDEKLLKNKTLALFRLQTLILTILIINLLYSFTVCM